MKKIYINLTAHSPPGEFSEASSSARTILPGNGGLPFDGSNDKEKMCWICEKEMKDF